MKKQELIDLQKKLLSFSEKLEKIINSFDTEDIIEKKNNIKQIRLQKGRRSRPKCPFIQEILREFHIWTSPWYIDKKTILFFIENNEKDKKQKQEVETILDFFGIGLRKTEIIDEWHKNFHQGSIGYECYYID